MQCVLSCSMHWSKVLKKVKAEEEFPLKGTVQHLGKLASKAAQMWIFLPLSIRECSSFKHNEVSLTTWLKDNQICEH